MKNVLLILSLAVCCGTALPRAQDAALNTIVIDRLDPALDAIVTTSAKAELVKGDYFGFLEGPLWVSDGGDGYLLFSDVAANRIYKWTPTGELTTFLDRSGFTGADSSQAGVELNNGRLYVIVLGSNGLTLD